MVNGNGYTNDIGIDNDHKRQWRKKKEKKKIYKNSSKYIKQYEHCLILNVYTKKR